MSSRWVFLGFLAGSAGAVTAITMADLGPDWYPIALALSAFPSVWLGGRVSGSFVLCFYFGFITKTKSPARQDTT
jgi:hypothetical protein